MLLENLSSVLSPVVHRGKSYLTFQVLDAYSWLYSILRSSSFKIHLRKHGLDPSDYPEFASRDQSPTEVYHSTEPEGIREGQVSGIGGSSHNQAIPLPGLPSTWDAFLSLPMDAGRSTNMTFLESLPHAVSYDHSGSSTHAARAHFAGFFQLSVAPSPSPPDRTGLQRWIFSIAPTGIPRSLFLFPILFTHGANSGFDT